MRRVALLLCLCPVAVVACGDMIDTSSQRYAGAAIFEGPNGAFHFRYYAPPWRPVVQQEGDLVRLVIGSDEQRKDGLVDYRLTVRAIDGDGETLARQKALRDEEIGWRLIAPVSELLAHGGDTGWDVTTSFVVGEHTHYRRNVYFSSCGGRSYAFELASRYHTEDTELDDLLRSFACGKDTSPSAPSVLEPPPSLPPTTQPPTGQTSTNSN